MRRRIPPAHVAVARTAPPLHRMRLGSRSASAIRTHAAARRTAFPCDQDARNRDPDTRATRQWICIGGRSGCAARAHRPGWARRAIDALPSTPSPHGERGEDARPDRASAPHDTRRGGLGLWQRVRPDAPHGRPAGSGAWPDGPPRLDHDALDLVDGDRIGRPGVELRRLRGGVRGDPLRVCERPPIRQIRRDPRRPKRVAAGRGRQTRGRRPPLDHGQDETPRQRQARQPPPRRVDALEERRRRLVAPVVTTCFGPRTAAAGFTGIIWLTTSQSPSMRMAARCCLTVGADPGWPRWTPKTGH